MTSMTLPPQRLIRLYLCSRRTRPALLLLAAIAAVLRATQPMTKDPGLSAQLMLMLITIAAAAVIAAGTRTPFGEPEHSAGSPLPVLRLTHLLTLTATAIAALALAAGTADYADTTGALLRNLAGFTGIALLTAALLGAHLAWTTTLGYVIYCCGQLDVQVTNLWTWPTQPFGSHTATLIALTLLTAGLTAVTFTGARDHRTDLS
jgi:hypothetical protein